MKVLKLQQMYLRQKEHNLVSGIEIALIIRNILLIIDQFALSVHYFVRHIWTLCIRQKTLKTFWHKIKIIQKFKKSVQLK